MSLATFGTTAAVALHLLIELALIIRILLLPGRQPASRIAWIVVVAALPVAGIIAYFLFGEANIGRRRVARVREVIEGLPDFPAAAPGDEANLEVNVPERYRHLFRVGQSISCCASRSRHPGRGFPHRWLPAARRRAPRPCPRCSRLSSTLPVASWSSPMPIDWRPAFTERCPICPAASRPHRPAFVLE